jgi:CubicO group peptidase (beta-lactamase class C family)
MLKKINWCFLFLAFCLMTSACKNGAAPNDYQGEIINGLRPPVYLNNHEVTYGLRERMEHWNVPAVSLAVVDGMERVYIDALGVKKIGDTAKVDVNTLFQAASVSKPITAVGVMTLAQKGILDIDVDVNTLLKSWQLPYEDPDQVVTVREILSHSAGLGVGGFEGYPTEHSLPSLEQILEGIPPANSPAVRVLAKPGTRFMYSGGGYQVLQKIMEDVTGRPFEQVMYEHVFEPLHMKHSYYAPLDPAQKENAAYGHLVNSHIPDYGPIHMESAAGGLWTTPGDLSLLLIEMMKAYNNQPSTILDSTTLNTMMKTHFWDFGLGVKVMGEGKAFRFSHGGATKGWHSHFMAFPERGQAVVVMTNGTNGWVLWPEVERSVANLLDWPTLQPKSIAPVQIIQDQVDAYKGTYEMNGLEVRIKADSSLLRFEGAGLKWDLAPIKTDTLEILDMEGQVYFKREEGEVKGLHLWFGEPDWSPYRAWDFTKKMDE